MAKILVIDDNVDLLQMMRLILQERGNHEVILSADGADGLSRALSTPPDLAIVDVMMPGVTGYDIVRRLREQPQTKELPILVLTARGQMIDRQTALQAGANDHMAKPVTPQTLLDKVSELIGSRAVTDLDRGGGGTLVSLLSLRGGVGVTTLAVNLALSAAGKTDKPLQVCLIDLCPSSGQVTLHLRAKAQHTWASLPDLGNNASPEEIARLLTPHASGLAILAAPFEPTHSGTLSASLIGNALAGLRQMFDLVIIDTPPLIDVIAAATLDASDHIVLVLTPEVGAVQATVATLRMMEEMEDKLWLVLNHISPQSPVPEIAVEKALHRSISLKVPYDPAQLAALPQGKPLALNQPASPLAVAVRELLPALIAR
jgi:pilus assembly protein CpaE